MVVITILRRHLSTAWRGVQGPNTIGHGHEGLVMSFGYGNNKSPIREWIILTINRDMGDGLLLLYPH